MDTASRSSEDRIAILWLFYRWIPQSSVQHITSHSLLQCRYLQSTLRMELGGLEVRFESSSWINCILNNPRFRKRKDLLHNDQLSRINSQEQSHRWQAIFPPSCSCHTNQPIFRGFQSHCTWLFRHNQSNHTNKTNLFLILNTLCLHHAFNLDPEESNHKISLPVEAPDFSLKRLRCHWLHLPIS